MSAHDPKATLRQIQDAAHRLQIICADKTLGRFGRKIGVLAGKKSILFCTFSRFGGFSHL
jgi:hypothetical protein